MKINDFWGDLTDISAKKKALVATVSGSDVTSLKVGGGKSGERRLDHSASFFKIKLNIF